MPADASNRQSWPSLGTNVGPFVLDHALGELPASALYRGRGPSGHEVTVEIGSTESNEQAYERAQELRRETAVAGMLQHSCLVLAVDGGETDDGRAWVARPDPPGERLDTFLGTIGRVPIARAMVLARDVLLGLAHAHELGVTHGDIRLETIYVTTAADGTETARLVGFGKGPEAQAEEDGVRSQRARFDLHPHTLPPEVLAGRPPSPSSDIYQLALVLAHLVVGRPLVPPGTLLQVKEQYRRRKLRYPPWLDETPLGPILKRCMERSVADRYPDATALLTAFDAVDSTSLVIDARLPAPVASLVVRPPSGPAIQGFLTGLPGEVVGRISDGAGPVARPERPGVVPVLPRVLAAPGVDREQIRASVADLSEPPEGTFDDHPLPGQVALGFDTFDLSVQAQEEARARVEAKRLAAARKSAEDRAVAAADKLKTARRRVYVIAALILCAASLLVALLVAEL